MARSQRKYDHEYKVQAVKLAKEIGGQAACRKQTQSPIINNLKIRNMKWIDNLIYTLLSACLLAGCEDSGSKELERMQGYWVHVRGHPAFTLSETGGRYTVTRKANVRGRILETAYPVTERNGCLFIETDFRIQFTYDKKTDRITLMPGGEYKRVTNPENKR